MVTEGQIDQILTGITFGMSLEDMLVLCEVDPEDMVKLQADQMFMARANAMSKQLSYDLLKQLNDVIETQISKGKDHAITWLLEKTNPRFSNSGDGGDKAGVINIFTHEANVESSDTVAVQIYENKEEPGEESSED